jgi:hypothetical protein
VAALLALDPQELADEMKASAMGISRILAKNDNCHTPQQFTSTWIFDNRKTWGDPARDDRR